MDFAKKHGLYRYCRFDHRVVAADWQEESGTWEIEVQDKNNETTRVVSDILINATGILSSHKWPHIAGLDQFQGQTMHSGAWDPNVDLTGKNVCLIGNGYVVQPEIFVGFVG